MTLGIGASAVGAGIGLLGDLATTAINASMQKKQFNREVAQEQRTYERNRADYLADLENERAYNSPQAQIDRIKEAGLNPNLMNGGSLVSGQGSSAATPMGNGSYTGISPVRADFSGAARASQQVASGLASSSNAEVERRRSDREIITLKKQWDRMDIENKYLDAEKRLNNAKTAAETDEILSREKKNLSDINVNNSVINLNNHKVNLVDKQASLAEQQTQLAMAKTALENLNAEKMRILMPYVAARAEAEYMLMNAQTDLAKQNAYAAFRAAELDFAEACRVNQVLDSGQVDAVTNQIKADTDYTKKETENYEYNMKTDRRSANASMLHGVAACVNAFSEGTDIYFTAKGHSRKNAAYERYVSAYEKDVDSRSPKPRNKIGFPTSGR